MIRNVCMEYHNARRGDIHTAKSAVYFSSSTKPYTHFGTLEILSPRTRYRCQILVKRPCESSKLSMSPLRLWHNVQHCESPKNRALIQRGLEADLSLLVEIVGQRLK